MKDKKTFKLRLKREMQWYSFLIVSIIALVLLTYIPMLTTIKYSFYNTRILSFGGEFDGITNYKALMGNKAFIQSLGNTFILALLSLLQIPIGFILASLINGLGRGKLQSFFRVSYYLPNIITGVSVVLIFQVVLKENGGLLNDLLSFLTGHKVTIGWLSDARYSRFGATILNVWRQQSEKMVLYYHSQYENMFCLFVYYNDYQRTFPFYGFVYYRRELRYRKTRRFPSDAAYVYLPIQL